MQFLVREFVKQACPKIYTVRSNERKLLPTYYLRRDTSRLYSPIVQYTLKAYTIQGGSKILHHYRGLT